MTNHVVEEEYTIKMIKPSKYKKTNTWLESSGELSNEEIAAVMYCDKVDSIQENIEKVNEQRKKLKNSLDDLIIHKSNQLWKIQSKIENKLQKTNNIYSCFAKKN